MITGNFFREYYGRPKVEEVNVRNFEDGGFVHDEVDFWEDRFCERYDLCKACTNNLFYDEEENTYYCPMCTEKYG